MCLEVEVNIRSMVDLGLRINVGLIRPNLDNDGLAFNRLEEEIVCCGVKKRVEDFAGRCWSLRYLGKQRFSSGKDDI